MRNSGFLTKRMPVWRQVNFQIFFPQHELLEVLTSNSAPFSAWSTIKKYKWWFCLFAFASWDVKKHGRCRMKDISKCNCTTHYPIQGNSSNIKDGNYCTKVPAHKNNQLLICKKMEKKFATHWHGKNKGKNCRTYIYPNTKTFLLQDCELMRAVFCIFLAISFSFLFLFFEYLRNNFFFP